ncbi:MULTISPECIES: diguanylate cyclase [Alphaproteobacteria]|uniref:diguanylate cyclase n=2 Tax=Alphaproteobacteria TaxID=28211 RepID=A0A512HPF3_9HYPH|nr:MULTISPECIES: diguanylate cyclase [Alphaproteobacteria]GEO87332.1 GGDEF domain-containing protein [Ciceribacter naphthalenivorans]GLR23797.1 GGDEF domain-containing protein [Ciceribacter naphthalenivorans]GLT06653.1 GGDEF domain-containing protein [Sphingomonas psychrolutea]
MEAHSLLITFLAQLGVISLTLTICSLARDRVQGELTLLRKFASGALFGATAVLLMNMPGELINGFRFDLRIVPIAVVGLISGPVGAAVAAILASAVRVWLGGAGVWLGLVGIGLAFAVATLGYSFAKRGFNGSPHVVIFSALNAGIAFLILFLLPANVRDQLTELNAHLILLLLNFLATLISSFFVRIDRIRRKNAQLNELHRQIVSALPDSLNVKDLQGRFLIANEATAKLMGAANAVGMVGTTDFDYYTSAEASLFWEQEQAFIRDPKPLTLEQQFERNGQTVWLSTIKAPYFEMGALKGIVSHTADITSQKALQAELISTQVLLETAMSEMADGLAMFDPDGRLVMWNRRYLELFPYVDERTCQGRTLAELLTAGVLRGDLTLPAGASPLSWVHEEVERSQSAQQSDLRLSDGRWVSKSTRTLSDGGWVTLYSDVSEKKAAVQQLVQLASKDGLTELANRRIFDRRLAEAFRTAQSSPTSLSLLMIDVDNFKAYNDTYGHPAGDEVLRQIAAVLRSACRGELDLVARYGGEEFAVILPTTSIEVAHDVAVRLAAAVRMLDIPHLSSSKGRVTVSIGLASVTGSMSDPQQLLKSCDQALYSAKAAGRDKVRAASVEDLTSMTV